MKNEQTRDNQKNLVFLSQFFAHPFGVPKNLENFFRGNEKNRRVKKDRNLKRQKSENSIFPWFLDGENSKS